MTTAEYLWRRLRGVLRDSDRLRVARTTLGLLYPWERPEWLAMLERAWEDNEHRDNHWLAMLEWAHEENEYRDSLDLWGFYGPQPTIGADAPMPPWHEPLLPGENVAYVRLTKRLTKDEKDAMKYATILGLPIPQDLLDRDYHYDLTPDRLQTPDRLVPYVKKSDPKWERRRVGTTIQVFPDIVLE